MFFLSSISINDINEKPNNTYSDYSYKAKLMNPSEITIGQLAKETECNVSTIRYYESIGLLHSVPRSSGNQRLYSEDHRLRLRFICRCRKLGLSQQIIRELLTLNNDASQSCDSVTKIASLHLDTINEQISQLVALRGELEALVNSCKGGPMVECRIIENLHRRESI